MNRRIEISVLLLRLPSIHKKPKGDYALQEYLYKSRLLRFQREVTDKTTLNYFLDSPPTQEATALDECEKGIPRSSKVT